MSKRSEEQDTEQSSSVSGVIPSNLTDRQLLEMIWSKVEKIDNMIEKMDQFEIRMSASENKIKMLEEEHEELQRGTSFIETEFQTQRQVIDQIKTEMVSKDEFMKLQKEVIDQSNRQRRKNVVFYNVPEGTEGKDCTGYINMLVKKIEENLKIETAHRSPTYDSRKGERENPRPIHALCITRDDRDEILEKAPPYFKDNLVAGKKVFISDDIHPQTRQIHKLLLEKQREFRSKGWLAYIPFRVPRMLKYRPGPRGTHVPLKTFRIE